VVWLYVSRFRDPQWDKPETYEWSSTEWASSQTIIINPWDADTHSFFITVYGRRRSAFSVTAAMGQAVMQLRDGVPQRGSLRTEETAFYSFRVLDPTADVAISVTPSNGNTPCVSSRAPS